MMQVGANINNSHHQYEASLFGTLTGRPVHTVIGNTHRLRIAAQQGLK